MRSLDEFARGKLADLDARHLRRTLVPVRPGSGHVVSRNGRRLVSFCDNDYLGLAHDPAVKAAARAAIDAFGAGAGASRLVTGNHLLHESLENELAALKGTEAALVFGSGYLANTGVIPALVGPGDLVLVDALAHACLWAGARASGAEVRRFAHDDAADLARILTQSRASHRHALVLTEGVFSMDGDRASLRPLSEACARFDAWLLVDDAHGLGVLGEGRGSVAAAGPGVTVPLQIGTLSKAAGSYGGYLCASAVVVELLRSRARTLVYSTALPPSVIAASLAALRLLATDRARCAEPLRLARLFAEAAGISEPASAIVPLVLGSADRALQASEFLAESGYLVAAIRPPTVPEGTARLRFTFGAGHDEADVLQLATLVRSLRGRAS
jgi:8-amino-7-oxononanoate synthase